MAASSSEVQGEQPLAKISRETIGETSEAGASREPQPILLADAEDPTVSDLLGSQTDQLYQGDRSLHDLGDDSQAQVTSVSQLSDVQPTDWAFQALQSLVERYGCIAGYPNGTFRGNRSATRYEMAAALNACLDQISDRFASKADLDAVKALQDEFAAELATLRGRVDGLEARVDTVEAQQFSTTTKLNGEVIFAAGGLIGENVETGDDIDGRLAFNQRTRLNLLTSFTGKDRLYTRLQSSNRDVNFASPPLGPEGAGTFDTRISFDTGNTGNGVILDRLDYKFPIGDKIDVTVFANAAFHHYYAETVNPFFEGFGGGSGSISFFGERNPIYRIGTVAIPGVAGVGTSFKPTDKLRFDVGYLAGNANDATATISAVDGADDGGLFGGSFSLLAQGTYKLSETSQVGLTYVRNNSPGGNLNMGAGTRLANVPFPIADGSTTGFAFSSDSVGIEATFGITDWLAIGGWAGYTFANQSGVGNEVEIGNAALNVALPDLGKEGAIGGLIFGLPPQVVSSDSPIETGESGTTYHLEANYQFPVSDNITITPGLIYLINPGSDSNASDIFVGVIRTTFRF
ncbi:MAG: iron uptake porin [Cyanobacteria bacterium P01_A01_bin.17]